MADPAKINRILLIVHPAFYYAKNGPFDKFSNAHISYELGNLGRAVNEAAKNPETLVVLVPTPKMENTNPRIMHRLGRFMESAKKRLGERCVKLTPEFGYLERQPKPSHLTQQQTFEQASKSSYQEGEPPPDKPKDPLIKIINDAREKLAPFNFAGVVEVQPSGQYTQQCVAMAGKRITDLLGERKIRAESLPPKNSMTREELIKLNLAKQEVLFKRFRERRHAEFGKRKPAPRGTSNRAA